LIFFRVNFSFMSRKHRPPLSRPTPASTPVLPETHARQVLDAGRYREAVELYKNLLKQERRSEWLEGLAASYAGRAKELASKGMLQEALVVWRNRASLCGKSLAEGPYLDWLLRAGAHHAALRLLTPTGDAAVTTSTSDLETRLAAVALTAHDSASHNSLPTVRCADIVMQPWRPLPRAAGLIGRPRRATARHSLFALLIAICASSSRRLLLVGNDAPRQPA
jgi:hypothetical protein